jgi:hypothetical protein
MIYIYMIALLQVPGTYDKRNVMYIDETGFVWDI